MEKTAPEDGEGRFTNESAELVVYQLAWDGDHASDGPEGNALIYSRIYVDGEYLPFAHGVTVDASGDFATASIRLHPRAVRFVPLGRDEWEKLVAGDRPA